MTKCLANRMPRVNVSSSLCVFLLLQTKYSLDICDKDFTPLTAASWRRWLSEKCDSANNQTSFRLCSCSFFNKNHCLNFQYSLEFTIDFKSHVCSCVGTVVFSSSRRFQNDNRLDKNKSWLALVWWTTYWTRRGKNDARARQSGLWTITALPN